MPDRKSRAPDGLDARKGYPPLVSEGAGGGGVGFAEQAVEVGELARVDRHRPPDAPDEVAQLGGERLMEGANLAQPILLQIMRALRWMAGDLATGSLWRVFRASWRMGVLLSYSQVLLIVWLGLTLAGGWFAARLADAWSFSGFAQLTLGAIAMFGGFAHEIPVKFWISPRRARA